jgi:hypothetical protein
MSTIIASNVSDGTLSIPTTYVTNGSAKAWVNFDGTGTIAVRDSLNVSSLTDVGTGDYTVNFTSSFADVNFSAAMGYGGNGANNYNAYTFPASAGGAVDIKMVQWGVAFYDTENCQVTCHGDLA